MRDIVIDLETLDTADTTIVPSIGAVVCDLETGTFGETFHVRLDVDQQIKDGYTFSASTLAFWLKQNNDARGYLVDILDRKTVLVSRDEGFRQLHAFIKNVKNAYVWGNGATFDLGICIAQWGKDNLPWQYWAEQDVRTVVSFAKRTMGLTCKDEVPFDGTAHDPVADAMHEAKYLMDYFKQVRQRGEINGEAWVKIAFLEQARELLTGDLQRAELDKQQALAAVEELKARLKAVTAPVAAEERDVDLVIETEPTTDVNALVLGIPGNRCYELRHTHNIQMRPYDSGEIYSSIDNIDAVLFDSRFVSDAVLFDSRFVSDDDQQKLKSLAERLGAEWHDVSDMTNAEVRLSIDANPKREVDDAAEAQARFDDPSPPATPCKKKKKTKGPTLDNKKAIKRVLICGVDIERVDYLRLTYGVHSVGYNHNVEYGSATTFDAILVDQSWLSPKEYQDLKTLSVSMGVPFVEVNDMEVAEIMKSITEAHANSGSAADSK